ncbi:DNA alkylation repair protein [Undibacterium sp. Jales W-56]|uniref:DNA alkylation repair protein n=1 Tax=Undibacterium sp. Jales W-56 TaxID=2897325 RepID=UPI0021D1D588|nr:DNA alkylation repair protein [Undibacterium sp. Jales W-56]MCU6433635.1 DNA alkylation repair protein [Undibacterium sp. Jales W-56]
MKQKNIIADFQQALMPLADPQRAIGMRAYMKDRFDYLGIAAPMRRKAVMPLIRALQPQAAAQLLEIAAQLWSLPEREYQYVAIDLLAKYIPVLAAAAPAGTIAQLLTLVQAKSWWDTVDGLAGVTGDVLRTQASSDRLVQELMDAAILHPDFWVRRIALLHQLGWRDATDTDRLRRYTLSCADEKEFFIRKAIGWALRDYAWHDPDFIREFLQAHQERLSGLSMREASKNLHKL